MNLNDLFNEEKVRLDPKCWTGKKIGNPKTKMKGGVRVNNCVPAESVAEGTGNIGNAIKSLYQKIYNAGDDEIEYFYHDSPVFAQYWDEYEGDLDSIIAEVDPEELQIIHDELESYLQQAGLAEEQELDEKWSQKYKSSINCANPKGFSQKAHCAGRKKNEDVAESLGKQIHSTFQSMGDSFSDAHLAKGISYFLQGRHQEGENWLRGKIPQAAQDTVFSKLRTLQAQGGVDVNKNANVQQYIDDKLVPWVKNQIQQHVKEGVMYGAENLHVGDDVIVSGDVNLKGATGVIDSFGQDKRFVIVDLYNHGRHSFHSSDVSANDYDNDEHDDEQGVAEGMWDQFQSIPELEKAIENLIIGYKGGLNLTDKGRAQLLLSINKGKRILAKKKQQQGMAEGEQQKGADYRDPKEVNYDDEYDAMVARVKKLAGLGPMKTVYDPAKRVYRNIPTAVQPKK